jgi:hypothetical protein
MMQLEGPQAPDELASVAEHREGQNRNKKASKPMRTRFRARQHASNLSRLLM